MHRNVAPPNRLAGSQGVSMRLYALSGLIVLLGLVALRGSHSICTSGAQPIGHLSRQTLDQCFAATRLMALPDRVKFWSRRFLGTPYHSDPLGEGRGDHDPDPVWDLGRVDCLTFVEEVMALSYSNCWEEFVPNLVRLRYRGGKPRFSKRYYTMAKGWIAAQVAAGRLQDITRAVGGRHVKKVSLNLDRRSFWRPSYRARFALLGKFAPRGKVRIVYIPLRWAIRLADRFPDAAVMHIVRAPTRTSPYLVSHTGLVVHRGGHVYFRHASRTPGRRKVEDRPLDEYLQSLSRFLEDKGWRPVLGVNLDRIGVPRHNQVVSSQKAGK